ncbi:hypothetical protein NHQ30_005447 [Ciborinia camelliae]|nr:hypothetical protein NHQ30_005447 [Ciborinia camelliae]
MSTSHLPLRTTRILRTLPLPQCRPQCLHQIRLHTRTLTSKPRPSPSPSSSSPILDPISLHRLEASRRAYHKRRIIYSASGFIVGMICIWVTATSIELPPPAKLDSSRPLDSLSTSAKVIVKASGEKKEEEEEEELVETGTSTIPTFPKYIYISDNHDGEEGSGGDKPGTPAEEYQLLGLGIRTVSFLSIQVYVIGLYISRSSIRALQSELISRAGPAGATTLIGGEKDELQTLLMHETHGEEIWNAILKNGGVKTMIRIVPTRNTDFQHLRDAWVRGLTARAQRNRGEYGDEAFGMGMGEFKGLLNRGSVPKGRELLLRRDAEGKLGVWYEDGERGSQWLGEVRDERISRGIWLGYLAGKNVSCEQARRNIVEGVMGLVERPVGSVVGQVHV